MDKKTKLKLINVTKQATSSGRMSYLRVYFDVKQTFSLKSLNIRAIFRNQLNISDGIFMKIVNGLQPLKYLCKRSSSRMFEKVPNTPLTMLTPRSSRPETF